MTSDGSGNGGNISLTSATGAIDTTAGQLDAGVTKGNAGTITLTAKNDITTAYISSYVVNRGTGNAGNIFLSTQGAIDTRRGILSASSEDGNGGAVVLAANGNITTGAISSNLGIFGSGNAGNISLISTQGAIDNRAGRLDAGVTKGNAGTITLTAKNDITTAGIAAYAVNGGNGNAGNISLTSTAGAIDTSRGALSAFSENANGGAIALVANGDTLTSRFGLINSTGKLGSGNITIVSNAPLALDNNAIVSDTFGSGKGGDIQITAPSISLANGAQVSASTHSSGQAGNITFRAAAEVKLEGATTNAPSALFASPDLADLAGIPPGTFLGGFIPSGTTTLPPNGTLFPSGVFTQTTIGSTGSAGNLRIETGRLKIKDRAAIATTTFGQGNAGDIFVQARDSISIANGSILSGVAGGASGNSGNVKLQTRSLSSVGGGVVQTQTLGEGNAGAIQVIATDAISQSGNGSGLRSGSGGSNNLLGNVGSKIGQGGDISVTTSGLSVADGAVVDAQTQSDSKGGDITVNANTLSAVNSGQLLTSTSGGGRAGDITVNASQLQLDGSSSGLFAQTTSAAPAGNLTLQPLGNGQNLIVNFQDGAQISASTSDSGRGGTLTITAPGTVTLSGNGIVSAGTTGIGAGGNLTLMAGQLMMREKAQATVSSQGAGSAGDLEVSARTIYLDDKAALRAETMAGQGNIHLHSGDLLLRHGSNITTNATGTAVGGNITIDTDNLVAVPKEDSDIRANATGSFGGRVIVNAKGIFGIQFRPQDTPLSDITASSALGPQFSGTVQINTPGIDPSRGLANLPTQLVDVSRQIAQGCPAGIGPRASKFVVTGRGGLPPTPQEATRSESPLADLGTPVRGQEHRASAEIPNVPTHSEPITLVEAQGWAINDKGEVILTAPSPNVTPRNPWVPSSACQVTKTFQ